MEDQTVLIKEITNLIYTGKLSGFRGDIGLTEGGDYVRRLEKAVRNYFKVKHAIAFNSATSALHSVINGDMIVSPFTFSSSASCVLPYTPIFADIDSRTYCISPESILEKAGKYPTVTGIMPVHLFGGVADMDKIVTIAKEYGWLIIEDACQAIGSKYKGQYAGTIGDCGIFSFNQAKQISCGEGGILITNDDGIAYNAKLKRNHGEVVDPDAKVVGYNYRMTEIEAIVAYHRFLKLDEIIQYRKNMVYNLWLMLNEIEGVYPQWMNPDVEYSWYVYSFTTDFNNHEIAKRMTEKGIPLRGGYITRPLNMLPIYDYQPCPICENIWYNRIVVTDVIGKSENDVEQFVSTLRQVIKEMPKESHPVKN